MTAFALIDGKPVEIHRGSEADGSPCRWLGPGVLEDGRPVLRDCGSG